jgi:hypothetical protein
MKQGYILWNQTTCGTTTPVYGVFGSKEKAEKAYKKLMKTIGNELTDEDSIRITYFETAKMNQLSNKNLMLEW